MDVSSSNLGAKYARRNKALYQTPVLDDQASQRRAAAAPAKKKPGWDDTQHDLNKYKLSRDEIHRRRLERLGRANTIKSPAPGSYPDGDATSEHDIHESYGSYDLHSAVTSVARELRAERDQRSHSFTPRDRSSERQPESCASSLSGSMYDEPDPPQPPQRPSRRATAELHTTAAAAAAAGSASLASPSPNHTGDSLPASAYSSEHLRASAANNFSPSRPPGAPPPNPRPASNGASSSAAEDSPAAAPRDAAPAGAAPLQALVADLRQQAEALQRQLEAQELLSGGLQQQLSAQQHITHALQQHLASQEARFQAQIDHLTSITTTLQTQFHALLSSGRPPSAALHSPIDPGAAGPPPSEPGTNAAGSGQQSGLPPKAPSPSPAQQRGLRDWVPPFSSSLLDTASRTAPPPSNPTGTFASSTPAEESALPSYADRRRARPPSVPPLPPSDPLAPLPAAPTADRTFSAPEPAPHAIPSDPPVGTPNSPDIITTTYSLYADPPVKSAGSAAPAGRTPSPATTVSTLLHSAMSAHRNGPQADAPAPPPPHPADGESPSQLSAALFAQQVPQWSYGNYNPLSAYGPPLPSSYTSAFAAVALPTSATGGSTTAPANNSSTASTDPAKPSERIPRLPPPPTNSLSLKAYIATPN